MLKNADGGFFNKIVINLKRLKVFIKKSFYSYDLIKELMLQEKNNNYNRTVNQLRCIDISVLRRIG